MKKLLNFINTKILKNKKLLTIFAVFAFLLLCLPVNAYALGDAGGLIFLITGLVNIFTFIFVLLTSLLVSSRVGLIILTTINSLFFILLTVMELLFGSMGEPSENIAILISIALSIFFVGIGIIIAVSKPNFPISGRMAFIAITAFVFICTFLLIGKVMISSIDYAAYKNEELNEAVRKNDIKKLERKIAAGANINSKNSREPVLFTAIDCKNKEVIELLLDSGVDINEPSALDKYPLSAAISSDDDVEMVKFLISKGAKVNVENKQGITPLDYAIDKNAKETVKVLVSNRANINSQGLLSHAVVEGRAEIAEYLLSKGADVNIQDSIGTPLYALLNLTLVWEDENLKLKIAQLLISKGADVNKANEFKKTPIFGAAYNKEKEMVDLLLANGANINAKDITGETPLDHTSNQDMREFLISRGAKSGDELK